MTTPALPPSLANARPPLLTGRGDQHLASRDHLGAPLTRLIGRETEIAAVTRLLATTRLLTLTGTGGTGKTRLALAVAAALQSTFTDGVFFVSLAALSEPDLVLPTIAKVLGVMDAGDQPLDSVLTYVLRERHLLLVLDNFEQVVSAAPQLVPILAACPHLHVIVTSRMPLHVSSEREFSVPPLALPDAQFPPSPDCIANVPAVALFVARAQDVKADFALTDANAAAVAAICTRLDGVPLAIELAAARLKILSPVALLARLENRLALLTTGRRDMPARQQTLRATIDWSHDLLEDGERVLFARLAVFVDACTLEAVDAVCNVGGDLPFGVLDGVESLVDKSLVQHLGEADDEGRFGMLETIREYSRERLIASGEHGTITRAHAAYYLELTERLHSVVHGPMQERVLEQFEHEHDNVRAALGWAIEARQGGTALRLVSALGQFWDIRGYLNEGGRWFTSALDVSTDVVSIVRADACNHASYLIRMQGNYVTARTLAEEGLAIGRRLEHQPTIASAHYNLGLTAQYQGDYAVAQAHYEEALAIRRELGAKISVAFILTNLGELARQRADYTTARRHIEEASTLLHAVGDAQGIAYALNDLGVLARDRGDSAAARRYLEESLTIRRAVNERRGLAHALHNLAFVARDEGDYVSARALHEESLALLRAMGDRQGVARSLIGLGTVAHHVGDHAAAETLCEESLGMAYELGDKEGIAECLGILAEIAGMHGNTQHAAQLWAAAQSLRETMGVRLPPIDQARSERAIATMRAKTDDRAWTAAWESGRGMGLEQAVSAALQIPEPAHETHASYPADDVVPPQHPAGLTGREVDVLRLIAAGSSNREIAATLSISTRTVNRHVENLYQKIGAHGRADATAYAFRHHLT